LIRVDLRQRLRVTAMRSKISLLPNF
jgi:hypothetical protein